MADYKREVAYRVFSEDIKNLLVVPREDDEYATQYFELPTGHLINRVFLCGALIDKQDIGTDTPFYNLKISDIKGMIEANVGQYSPAVAQIVAENIEFPCFVAVIGKIKSREYNEKVYFGIAAESITEIDEAAYERWIAETEVHTIERQDSSNV